MNRPGHFGITLILGTFAVVYFEGLLGVGFTAIMLVTMMLPDIDTVLPGQHRGATHTVFFASIMAFLSVVATAMSIGYLKWAVLELLPAMGPHLRFEVSNAAAFAGAATFASILGHILADSLTVGRGKYAVKPFWPLSRDPLRFGLVRADSLYHNTLLFTAGAAIWLGTFVYTTGALLTAVA